MNISLELSQKRVINPVWSSDHSHDSSIFANTWPVRPQSRPRRFYSTPKARRNFVNVTQFSPQITPMKVDIDQFNKQKPQSSKAFCSTSKVKYMPLHRISPNMDSSSVNWCSSNSGMFPMLARPSSRPVILHGQRYTIMAIDDERISTGISCTTKDEDKLSPKTEYVSEQRRRFYEAERSKCNTRIYRDSADSSEYRITSNYCLSGHRIFTKSSLDTLKGRLNHLHSAFPPHNGTTKKEETIFSDRGFENIEDDQIFQRAVFEVNDNKQVTIENGIAEAVISVEISEGTKEDTGRDNLDSTIDVVLTRAINNLENAKTNNELMTQSKQLLSKMIRSFLEETLRDGLDLQDLDINSMDDCWSFLEPKSLDSTHTNEDDVLDLFRIKLEDDTAVDIDSVTVLSKLFVVESSHNAPNAWHKIFPILKISTVDLPIFTAMVNCIRTFQCDGSIDALSDVISSAKICFWIQLLSMLLAVEDDKDVDVLSYLRVLATLLVNRNVLDDDKKSCAKVCLEKCPYFGTLTETVVDSSARKPLPRLLDSIPWLFKCHYDLFHRALSIDDVATVIATVTNRSAT